MRVTCGRVSASGGRVAVLAVVLAGAVIAGGCSDDDDGGEALAEENMMPAEEGADALASLRFASAGDDARFRCLLETLAADAEAAGLGSTPPHESDGEISRSWCTDPAADDSACLRGMIDALSATGARALSVRAQRADDSAVVTSYGFRTVRNPPENGTADAPAWSLHFERSYGESDAFTARFVPFVDAGRTFDGQLYVFDRFGYRGADITVTYPVEPPAELLGRLVESPERFESVLLERYDTLLADFEERVADDASGLDDAARESALADARAHFGTRRELVTRNAARFHELLNEQVALDRCS